jgi:cupin superfamily acireductone dioxygenase involved in methionine salvage
MHNPMEIVTRKENKRRIWIIVISLLVLAGGVGLSVHYNNKREEVQKEIPRLIKEKNEKEQKIATMQAEFFRFSAPYGFRTEDDVLMPEAPATPIDPQLIRNFLNRWRARLAEKGVTTYKDWGETAGASGDGMIVPKLFEEVHKLIDAARKEEEATLKESGAIDPTWKWNPAGPQEIQIPTPSATSDILKVARAAVEEQKKADEEVKNSREVQINANKSLEQKVIEIRTKRATLEQALRDAQGKRTETVVKASEEKQARLKERKEYQDRLDYIELLRQLALERQEPDGRIIFADMLHGVVYIDIKQKDGLFRGTKFKVFGLEKGGTRIQKGEIQVINILTDYSRCAILRLLNPAYPMKAGDYIYDEFYDRERILEFTFAGHFIGPQTPAELERRLREFKRYRYSPVVSRETNYLVVGEDYEKHPNYISAIRFGIKIIREKDFYTFLGFDY